MGQTGTTEERRQHDIKNALLLIKQLAELLESGFTPDQTERDAIVKQLKKAHDVLKDEIK